LRRVRRERLIGAPAFAFASLLSLAKFARRAALTAARRLSS